MTKPATPPDPRYIRIAWDIDTLTDLEKFNEEEAILHPTGEIHAGPLSEDAVNEDREIVAARATREEEEQWLLAHQQLRVAANRAHEKLDAARAEWEQAQGRHSGALQDAYNDYRPVQEAIYARLTESEKILGQHEQQERERRRRETEAAQAAEDAALGPRLWVVVQRDAYGPKSPDMLVPIVHLVQCPTFQGVYYRKELRAPAVLDIIQRGGPELRRGAKTGKTLHTKLCGRCKPADSLRAHLGDLLPNFERWLEEVDALQPPRPTEAQLKKVIDPWLQYRRGGDGYNLANSDQYRALRLIEPHEELVGWVRWPSEGTLRYLATDAPERLAHLIESLPAQGYVARYFTDLGAVADEPCKSAVAVRRMTPGERRRFAADKAAARRAPAQ